MRYSSEITINLPRERVIELFDNTENLYKWMKGLESFEAIEGSPGQVGAKSRMVFQMGKRRIEMVETITKRDLPNEFATTYETKGVYNEVRNTFEPIDDKHTRYQTEHFFRFDSIAMRIIAFLMPAAFKKQSMQYLQDFKAFAEAEDDVEVTTTDVDQA